ncbi:flagellar hook-associated protein FlgK (plasmid) [Paroceanicella profunda]|uniref:Flagellar hook-associated protein 1 n=1 Tax=Paroceanicella profunda TaxID=2579971 RepID=A0A5B8G413_9RHOB|nr:flagellar hook-associated protein FlgK [Paroceanicella profunda]QDL94740.1 flagellar hook-associated protein FlgK [Paroceanicella profunda]
MSISQALNNAYSGLVASSRRAGAVSDNVANAMTDGFARRSVALSSRMVGNSGGGVRVDGISRATDLRATADRRRAEAFESGSALLTSALARLAEVIGEPGADGALATRATAFGTALATLGDTPESTTLQGTLLETARAYAGALNSAAAETRALREEADGAIDAGVTTVNTNLAAIADLNREILVRNSARADTAALEDERQRLIDEVNEIIPLRVARRNDQVALYSAGGATLLDGRAFELGFERTATITADMTLASGGLSGLTLNGRDMDIGQGSGMLEGGRLAAAFELRDVALPEATARLDALAADLVARFEDPAVDTTLAVGDPGLFTDAGSALDPLDTTGLAGRIEVNAAVDPSRGGSLWRLRDGINAVTQGLSGDDTLLRAMDAAFSERLPASAVTGVSGTFSAATLASELSSLVLGEAATRDATASYASGQASALREHELSLTGVDTDQEMQDLLLVQTAYAANARVITAIDEMLQQLLEI